MSYRKFLVLPRLILSGIRAPKDVRAAWNAYWGGIRRTGAGGDVLWDGASETELRWCRETAERFLPRELPVVDLGTGNGRYARMLASVFPRTIGVDFSERAVELAKNESKGIGNLEFRAADVTDHGWASALHGELGDANVFVRGVFHVLTPPEVQAAASTIETLLGTRGVLLFQETAFPGSALDYIESLTKQGQALPAPLGRCIESGLRPPRHFSAAELDRFFPAERWDRLAAEPVEVHAVAMNTPNNHQVIPGFFAALKPRSRVAQK